MCFTSVRHFPRQRLAQPLTEVEPDEQLAQVAKSRSRNGARSLARRALSVGSSSALQLDFRIGDQLRVT